MPGHHIAYLDDRAVVRVEGPDAVKLLQGVITNDVSKLSEGQAVHAGLLSPQGKILADFFAVLTPDGLLLDVPADRSQDLMKRLGMYKLRADVAIRDAADEFKVMALWGPNPSSPGETSGTRSYADPRHPDLGLRILAEARFARDVSLATNGRDTTGDAYHAHRVSLGVPEGGRDYEFGDAYPHDANFDLFRGVSFTKGCYVGQEIVARMQHKSVIRRRVVRVTGRSDLAGDRAAITAGGVTIGRLGTVAGAHALALLRLDRVAEFRAKGTPMLAGNIEIAVDPRDEPLVSAAARPEERPAGS